METTSREIAEFVTRCLRREPGHLAESVELSLSPVERSSSFRLERIDARLGGGVRKALLLKRHGTSGLTPQASPSKLGPFYDPSSEIRAYQSVLSNQPGTPESYGFDLRPDTGRYWLLLEWVPGDSLSDIADLRRWCQAAQWLARFHERTSCLDLSASWIPEWNETAFGRWRDELGKALDRLSAIEGPCSESLRKLHSLWEDSGSLCASLLALDQGLIHGEFYPSNILVRSHGDSAVDGTCVVDWEGLSMGPKLLDLAALTAGRWEAWQRSLMIDAYRDAAGPSAFTGIRSQHGLVYCRAFLLLQWVIYWAGHDAKRELLPGWIEAAWNLLTQDRDHGAARSRMETP